MKKVLFVCNANQLRSPTAEALYKKNSELHVKSAGISNLAKIEVTEELILWADIIFVMETDQYKKLRNKYYNVIRSKKIICLDIPDEYEYMDKELIMELTYKLKPYIGLPFKKEES